MCIKHVGIINKVAWNIRNYRYVGDVSTVKSSADQVLEANRLATDAKNENVLLKEEVKKLKQRLKDEQDAKHAAVAVIDKKEGALRESIKDLLGKIRSSPFFVLVFLLLITDLSSFQMLPT